MTLKSPSNVHDITSLGNIKFFPLTKGYDTLSTIISPSPSMTVNNLYEVSFFKSACPFISHFSTVKNSFEIKVEKATLF